MFSQSEQAYLSAAFPFVFVWDTTHTYLVKIAWADIIYLKSEERSVQIVTAETTHTIAASLSACEKNLPPVLFKRVHRSYIVNVSKIDKLNKTEIIMNSQVISLARTFADTLFKDFVEMRLLV